MVMIAGDTEEKNKKIFRLRTGASYSEMRNMLRSTVEAAEGIDVGNIWRWCSVYMGALR
jgi:hypothetical protein